MNYLLKNCRVVDPSRNIDSTGEIAVTEGRIAEKAAPDAQIVDLKGLVAAPGFIDLHVHLRQPGKTAAETIATGTRAAAAGGFTSIVAMPNTSPCADNPGTIQYVLTHAEKEGVVHVLPCGAMTKGSEGVEMSPLGALRGAGVVALSDDGRCVQNHELMRHIMEYSRSFDLPILDHAEDKQLASDGVMHEGYWSVVLGMKGIPAEAEQLMIERDALLAKKTGCRIHIQHVSTADSVEIIRHARAKGIRITGEATPHHFTLTDVEIKKFDSNYKMNPPLRSEADRLALIEGLRDGTITVIATDHAPHTATDKLVEFDYAPFGIIGLETAVPLALTELYHRHVLTLPELVSKFTSGPADVLGLPLGTLAPGSAADITVFDPEEEYVIDPSKFKSKARNTPFGGMTVKGRVKKTMVSGKFVYED